tara:strand:- start:402 stop:677 length:276 start_codon:yes stop_codon:yes gene_type:complete
MIFDGKKLEIQTGEEKTGAIFRRDFMCYEGFVIVKRFDLNATTGNNEPMVAVKAGDLRIVETQVAGQNTVRILQFNTLEDAEAFIERQMQR